MHRQRSAQTVCRIIMWIPKLNVGLGLDHDLVSRADWYCVQPSYSGRKPRPRKDRRQSRGSEGGPSGFPGGINSVGASSGNA